MGWPTCSRLSAAIFFSLWLAKRGYADLPPQRVGDFITGCALFGVIVGGRLGYVFFYKPEMLREPLSILRVWEGGMSSHGGMLGLLLFTLYYARRHKISWTNLGDNLVVTAPIGLFFGRCANFINGELYGRVANVSWAMQFPKELLDHPQEADRAVAACARIDPSLTTPDAIVGAVRQSARGRERTALNSDAASSVAALRSLLRRYRSVRDSVVCADADAPAERRSDRIVFHLLRDLSDRRGKFPRTGCRVDRPFTRGQFFSFFLIAIGAAFIVAAKRRPTFPRACRSHSERSRANARWRNRMSNSWILRSAFAAY